MAASHRPTAEADQSRDRGRPERAAGRRRRADLVIEQARRAVSPEAQLWVGGLDRTAAHEDRRPEACAWAMTTVPHGCGPGDSPAMTTFQPAWTRTADS